MGPRRHGHAGADLPMVLPGTRMRGSGTKRHRNFRDGPSARPCLGWSTQRDVKRQGWLDHMKDYSGPRLGFGPGPLSHFPMSTCRDPLHVHGNGFGNLEVAALLDFLPFQQISWK